MNDAHEIAGRKISCWVSNAGWLAPLLVLCLEFDCYARRGWLLALGVLSIAPAAIPEEQSAAQRPEIVGQSGWIGIFDSEKKDYFSSVEIRLAQNWHGIRPWAGVTLVESGSWLCGAGFVYNVRLPKKCRLTLGSGPFYYRNGRDVEDLGFDLEFYSFLEASREFRHGEGRLGLRLGHLSNAGLGRRNPGTETLALVAVIPFGRKQ